MEEKYVREARQELDFRNTETSLGTKPGYGPWISIQPWTLFATFTFPRPNPRPGCPNCPTRCPDHWSIVGHARASGCFSRWWYLLLRDGIAPAGSWGTRGLEKHKLGARHIHALIAIPETAPRKGMDAIGVEHRIPKMRELWGDVGGGFCRIERVRSGEHASRYVSKYCTKTNEAGAIAFFGRRSWQQLDNPASIL